MNNSLPKSYQEVIKKYPVLTKDQERALLATKDDPNSMDILIKSNLRFVISIAKNFLNKGLSFDELVQEGVMGLITAIEKFDLNTSYKLVTYAKNWIMVKMQQAMYNMVPKMHIPFNKMLEMHKVKQHLKKGVDFDEAFENSGINPTHKTEIYNLIYKFPLSMDFTYDPENEKSLSNTLVDTRIDPHQQVENTELMDIIAEALNTLDDREKFIIERKFGINNCQKMTSDTISKLLGISSQRVQQIEKGTMEKLKKSLSKTALAYI